ncbi:MAG: hypothetical protein HKN12_06040, partial [Gemmatimonadetes bacterium]|nr:hypothetical protein [Gemmatimonadota bacterium]
MCVPAGSDFAGIGPLGKAPAPAFRDLDADGDLDCLVGRFDGTLTLLMNVGTPAVPAYERTDNFLGIDVGVRAVPAFADYDGDGDPELFIGESGGGLNFYRNVTGPQPAAPAAFALQAPAPDAEIDGRRNAVFTWDPSFVPGGGEAAYELRVTDSLTGGPSGWKVFPVTGTQQAVRLYAEGLRFATDIWWTVAARDGCAMAPVPEWRRAVHATVDLIHGEQPPQQPFGGHAVDPVVNLSIRNAFPSPSADRTTVEFTLPSAAPVRVTVHDASGRMVSELLSTTLPAGTHTVDWDGTNGRGLASGTG